MTSLWIWFRRALGLQETSGSSGIRLESSHSNVIATEGGVAAGRDVIINNSLNPAHSMGDEGKVHFDYLECLRVEHQSLSLAGLDVGEGDASESAKPIYLKDLYIGLWTRTYPLKEEGKPNLREENRKPLSALEILRSGQSMVLTGDPGGGKSTFVKATALQMGEALLSGASEGQSVAYPGKTPIVLALRHFSSFIAPVQGPGSASLIWDYLRRTFELKSKPEFFDLLKSRAKENQICFFLDGLDEIADSARRVKVLQSISDLRCSHPQIPIVVTCRTLVYERKDWKLAGFESHTLAPFTKEQQQEFIQNWYATWTRADASRKEKARKKQQQLLEALGRADIARLSSNPLLLTVMAIVNTHRSELPQGRCQLYEEAVNILLYQWDKDNKEVLSLSDHLEKAAIKEPPPKHTEVLSALQELAYEAHAETLRRYSGKEEQQEAMAEIPLERLKARLSLLHEAQSGTWAQELVENIINLRAGLLIPGQAGFYTFPHRTFQEYLAGRHVGQSVDFHTLGVELLREGPLWREVILMAVGGMVQSTNVSLAIPLGLVANLVPEGIRNDLRPHWFLCQVAGEILLEIGLRRIRNERGSSGMEYLNRTKTYLQALALDSEVDLIHRVRMGSILGRLGDDRKGVGLDANGVPDLDWVRIPAGAFVMGSKQDWHEDCRETPEWRCQWIAQDFGISRYPVTVAQYQAFVSKGGYEEKRFWSKEGWEWKTRYGVTNPQSYSEAFQSPNHPQVGVSCYEAEAFCCWLSQLLGKEVRLPEEWEWEKAARDVDGRTYPWGEDGDLAKQCNCAESGIGHTSMVGLFESGNSSYGVSDLSGNCFEWCRTPWINGYEEQYTRKLSCGDRDGLRVLRGGSFFHDVASVRCAARYWDYPYLRDRNVGFRVVLSPF